MNPGQMKPYFSGFLLPLPLKDQTWISEAPTATIKEAPELTPTTPPPRKTDSPIDFRRSFLHHSHLKKRSGPPLTDRITSRRCWEFCRLDCLDKGEMFIPISRLSHQIRHWPGGPSDRRITAAAPAAGWEVQGTCKHKRPREGGGSM